MRRSLRRTHMTTKDAIKLLPIDESLKLQILNTFDYMDNEQKMKISRIAWKTYDYLRQSQIDFNIEKQLDKVENGQAELGPVFGEEVLKQSEQDMKAHLSEKSGAVDLETARQAVQKIIREMEDAKAARKKPQGKN